MDAYAVFARMLKASDPPDDWDALVEAARTPGDRLGETEPQKG